MLIRHKLNSLSGLFLGALLLLLAGVWWSSRHLDRLHSAQALTLTLDNRLLEIHLSQTNFLMLLDERQAIQLRREADLFKQDLKTLQDNLDTETHLARIERLQQDLSDYLGLFETLVEESRVIGLDHESGLYGSLRQAVHRAEKAVTALQRDDLLAGILQLRRDEKDFMLRSDLKYLDKFNTDFDALLQRLGDNDEVRAALTRYQEDFTALVNARTRVGLQPDTGLKARLHAKMHDIDDQFEQLQGQLTEQLSLAQQRTRWQLLAFGLAVASLVVFLTILIARGLNRDLSHTTGIIQRIAEQNDLTLELKLSGRDEFSSMGRHFDAMLQGVRRLIQHTKEAVDQLTQVTAELSANAEQTSAGGRQQLTEADLLATAITEMAATIDEIARNTELATERTQRTDTNAQAGQNQVQDTIRHIESLSGRLQESTRAVQELAHNSEAIGSVLNVIRGIAEQTNLLALNAAIEAARAGEQGRGFAVVAGEVRALAQRTQTATAEIADIITALQQKIQGLVDLIQTCHGEGLDSVTQANQAGALLARISEDMGHILDMNTQIAAAIEEQSQVTNEVNRNVVAIRDVAERTAVASQGNAHASARVAQQSESLARLISRFRC